jgi:hypothetical protein
MIRPGNSTFLDQRNQRFFPARIHGFSPSLANCASTALRFQMATSPLERDTAMCWLSGLQATHQIDPDSSGNE